MLNNEKNFKYTELATPHRSFSGQLVGGRPVGYLQA